MSDIKFGRRNEFGRSFNSNQLGTEPPVKPVDATVSRSAIMPMIILLVLGTTGLAGLGLHRFYLGHYKAGTVFLVTFCLMVCMAIYFALNDIDAIGKPMFLIAGLIVTYGCIEAYFFSLRRAISILWAQFAGARA